ncbi:DUF4344 domain-containing metallopeptidase [Mycolicibacterium baixiangningiae]|uniref:DUF4344 domain-containing metallopeptidase n=1 Tax=Mycolicibacterium baixiangningiae TaxID=2761578 RepID=UPI0027DA8B1B|nr:DUF4344 domain-containing metallopeptidase [Mycolicibacterium baixiangningiae]
MGAQCDEANAFWSSDDRTVTICFEDADLSQTTFEKAGDEDPSAATLGAERATFYHELGHATLDTSIDPADVHEYDLARMYNFQCWIYGADPQGNAFIVDEGLVPEDRADSCEAEYDRMSRAWLGHARPASA